MSDLDEDGRLGQPLPAEIERELVAHDVRILEPRGFEYLDSVLPHSLREQLSARMEGPAPARGTMRPEEALANLLESSPSIVARLEELGFDAPDQ